MFSLYDAIKRCVGAQDFISRVKGHNELIGGGGGEGQK